MTPQRSNTICLHPDDDVEVARVDMAPGAKIGNRDQRCENPIPAGHKVAVRAISAGKPIIKYGQIIGFAGDTGFAREVGVYFELRVHGMPVDAREWWDKQWYFSHISGKIKSVKKELGIAVHRGFD